MRLGALIGLLVAVGLAACGADTTGSSSARISVVATTTHVADLVRNVAGDGVEVRGLLAPNADPHGFDPRPSDVRSLIEAELVLASGGDPDQWVDELVDSAGTDTPVVRLIEHVTTIGGSDPDPHWWQDPRNAIAAVAEIERRLTAADPEGAARYRRNAVAYARRIERLDREIARCMESVPSAQRKLVTTHDAFGYFARRYDIEVIGAAIPSLSTQAQPSAGDTARLVRQIRAERVSAVFAESGVNPKLERAVAAEAGARVGRPLWADALGPKGSSGATYLEATTANAQALLEGFTGRSGYCELQA